MKLAALFSRVCVLLEAVSVVRCKTVVLNGAGASFPSKVYERWISGYKFHRNKHVQLSMTYDSVGSGSGKARIKGEQEPDVHFAGSDYPLTEEELASHPELTQFPTMAGSVVLVYNIPKLHALTLSLETIVGIYNCTLRRWDDPKIQELNPNTQMPDDEITVLARSDKSGTTYAFTNCLSSYSSAWKNVYGTFADGLDSKRIPYHWNTSCIKFFGNTNNGMSGMLTSLHDSIGYMSIADAIKSNASYAFIQKSSGSTVVASVESVQKAITSANGSLNIANTPDPDSYPFASFTVLITRRINPSGCDSMIEFVRFVEWAFYNDIPRNDTVDLFMVPLDLNTINIIKTNILQTMICRGENVWDRYLQLKQHENEVPPDTSWVIPTYGGIGVLVALVVTLIILFGQQQYRMHKEVLNDTWKLNPSDIIIDSNIVEEHKRAAHASSSSRRNSEVVRHAEHVLSDQAWLEQDNVQGVFQGTVISLSATSIRKMSMKDKQKAIFIRDSITHLNVMSFIGLTLHRCNYLGVYSGVTRGTILEVLDNPKYQIQKNCIVSFIKGLADGMKYLHKKGIVHGKLKSSNCLVDVAWNIKITGWCECRILESTFGKNLNINTMKSITDDNNAKALLWTAPELIKFDRPPSQSGDVYSFGMVIQEMLTGEEPYSERDNLPSDIITAVVTRSLRPKINPNTPIYIQRLLEAAWEMDPAGRPTFEAICHGLKSAYPKDLPILDSIIESFEEYVETLEQKLTEKEEQIKNLTLKTKEHLLHTAPPCILDKMLNDGHIKPQTLEGISTVVVLVSNIDEVVDRVTKDGIFNTLKHFYDGLDTMLASDDLYIVERHAGKTVYAIGLPNFNKYHAVNACSIALQVKTYCHEFTRTHLDNVMAEIRLKIGVSSSSALAGVLSSNVPRYTVIAKCFQEATQLAFVAAENTIRVSLVTFEDVQDAHNLSFSEIAQSKERCYLLEDVANVEQGISLRDSENDSIA